MKKLILSMLILLVAELAALADPQEDVLVLEGLKQRGLFSLIEFQCQARISDPESSQRTRMEWTVHLINSVTHQALRQPADQRARYWKKAQDVADDFSAQHVDDSVVLPVKLQAALALTARGELLRLEATISKDGGTQRVQSREQLRRATRAFNNLQNEIQTFLPRVGQEASEESLSQTELLSLRQNLHYHLARTYRNQANTYDAGTNDHIAALQRAITSLNKPLTQLAEEDPLVPAIHLALSACHRELKQFPEAQTAIDSLQKMALSPQNVLKLRAETVRLALAQQDLETTLELLNKPRESNRVLVPEYDLAFLDTFIYFWGKAAEEKNTDQAENYQQQAVLTVKQIEQMHGPYWGRVAELRLLRHAGMNGNSSNLVVLERTADDLYRKDKFSEAVDAYDATANAAQQAGNNDLAFRVLYKAALIEQKRGNTDAYIERLTTMGVQLRSHPQAPAVHMLGIRTVIEILKTDKSRQKDLETLLTEHLTYFAPGTTVDQAAIWLGTIQHQRQSYDDAIESYMAVRPTYQDYSTILTNLATCWEAKLKQQESTLDDAATFIKHLRSLIFDEQGNLPQAWNNVQRYAATTLARMLLTYSTKHYEEVEQLLAAAMSEQEDEDWLAIASSLQVVSLAAQGKNNAAQAHIEALSTSKPSQWMEMLNQLQTVAAGVPESTQVAIAQIQIELFNKLSPLLTGVKPEFRMQWGLLEAGAYMQSGNLSESITRYQALAEKYPRHGLVQLSFAQALTRSDDHLQQGLIQWRRVLQGNPPRSDRWYQAKYNIAELYIRNGQQEEARKQILYLKVTSGFGTWEPQFQKLLRRTEP